MSIIFKLVICSLIIALIIIGIWWWYSFSHQTKKSSPLPQKQTIQTTQNTPTNTNKNVLTSPKDTSDSALSADLSVIDNQIASFNTDISSVNQIFTLKQAGLTTDVRNSISVSTIINIADSEIDQKTKDLNDMIIRIDSTRKISSSDQAVLNSSLQNEIDQLNSLKSKIDIDTNTAAAKIDYSSIAKSYGIYGLILPQTRIVAAADSAQITIDSLFIVGGKIQSRISGLTGVNSSTIKQRYADFILKINDAFTQAQGASNEVLKLHPDLGDASKMQTNNTALNDAWAKLKILTDDLNLSRKNLGDIATFLRENSGTATPANQ